MSPTEWATFGGFVALLVGLSLVNPKLATIAGLGVIGIVFVKYLDSKVGSTPTPTGEVIA